MSELAYSRALSRPNGFKAQELANAIWAFATCGSGRAPRHSCQPTQLNSVVAASRHSKPNGPEPDGLLCAGTLGAADSAEIGAAF